MTEVALPDGTVLVFPDAMSRDEIKVAIDKKFGKTAKAPKPTPNTDIPPGMVLDPRTNQYVDTALAAERMGKGQGAIANVMAGVPFIGSYFDEAMGAADSALTGRPAEIGQEITRQSQQQFQESNPKTAIAARIGGGLLAAAPVAAAAGPAIASRAASTLGGRALQGAAAGVIGGAAEGAVYGAGEGTEGNRAAKAGEGAAWGGLVGGVLGGAAPYAAEGIKQALMSLKGKATSVISSALGVSPEAARVIKSALDRGDMAEATASLNRAGGDAMLADSGQAARELLDAAANSGGQAGAIARKGVESRVDKASADVTSALDATLGKPVGVNTSRGAVRQSTEAARSNAYDAAYSKPIDYASGRGRSIEAFLRRVPQGAIQRANELMRLEGLQSKQILATIGDDGTISYRRMPDVRQLDYITRALNDVADAADGQGKLGGTTALGRATKNLSSLIRNNLRSAVPEYGVALDTAADAISRSKAIETGSKLFSPSMTRETLGEALKGASKAERDAMKQGVRDGLDDMLANVQAVISDPDRDAREALKLLRTVSSRANSQKLSMLLGPKDAATLERKLDQAATTFELRAAIAQNSKTAIRQAIQQGVESQTAPGVLETLGAGSPGEAGKRFVQVFTGATEEAQALRKMGIYEDIARALTQIRGPDAEKALRTVQAAMNGAKLTEVQAARVGRLIATSGALAAHREGTRQLTTQ